MFVRIAVVAVAIVLLAGVADAKKKKAAGAGLKIDTTFKPETCARQSKVRPTTSRSLSVGGYLMFSARRQALHALHRSAGVRQAI